MEISSDVVLVAATLVGLFLLGVVYVVNLIRSSKEENVQKITSHPPQKKEKKRQTAQHLAPKQSVRKKQEKWTQNSKHTFSHPWLLTSLKGHSSEVLDMDFSANGKFIASCADDAEPDDASSSASSGSSGIVAGDGVGASDAGSDVGSSNDAASDSGCSVSDTNKENVEPKAARGGGGGGGQRSRKNVPGPGGGGGGAGASQGGRQRSRRQKKNAAPAKKAKARTKGNGDSRLAHLKEDNKLLAEMAPSPSPLPMPMPAPMLKFDLRWKLKCDDFELWQFVKRYALDKDKLYELSYPVESADHPGHATVYITPSRRAGPTRHNVQYRRPDEAEMPHMSERKCARCFRRFFLSEKAKLTGCSSGIFDYYWSEDPACLYHWGKLRLAENSYMYQYSCCNGRPGAHGCSAARFHVWVGVDEGENGPLAGYVQTRPCASPPSDGNYGVYALDCEMCYTADGLEVAKVTVVTPDGRRVYDTFVLPENQIVDYNTRFSGITPEDLNKKGATKPLKKVQRELLSFISSETILIGHGLENDLRGLRIIHANIVDTALLFPHKRGFPFKYSLKNLVNTILNRDIQDAASGHNSYEDACACVDLILWKLRRETRPLTEIASC